MRQVAEFLSELIRAANDVERRDAHELSMLLYQAIVAITEMRGQAGIPSTGTPRDTIIRLRDMAAAPSALTAEQLASALLEAAEMIRTLRILIDSDITLKLMEHDVVE
jgi:hypothetical protein